MTINNSLFSLEIERLKRERKKRQSYRRRKNKNNKDYKTRRAHGFASSTEKALKEKKLFYFCYDRSGPNPQNESQYIIEYNSVFVNGRSTEPIKFHKWGLTIQWDPTQPSAIERQAA